MHKNIYIKINFTFIQDSNLDKSIDYIIETAIL